MAAALVLPSEAKVGDVLALTGSGLATSHAYTAALSGCGLTGLTLKGSTSAGAFDIADVCTLELPREGLLIVDFDDGTNTLSASCAVFKG